MKPEANSKKTLKITQAQAKMFEYAVPSEHHLKLKGDPARLFSLTIGMLGDVAASISQSEHRAGDESQNLQFSAHFFNAYLEGEFRDDMDAYLLLLASSAFYLSHIPGSSLVLAKKISADTLELEGAGLEHFLLWLLCGERDVFTWSEGLFTKAMHNCATALTDYYAGTTSAETCAHVAATLRSTAYEFGSPRQLLFADICAALMRLKIQNSARYCLPRYSNLVVSEWESVLNKEDFLRELWSSQHLLGEKDVYAGASAIVQMPTSAGKTRAIEIIIRSAFMANRTSLAVIVAPFRALCHEINRDLDRAFQGESVVVNELTDALQPDVNFAVLFPEGFKQIEKKNILVVTPEKLLYILRHEPELAQAIGLVIYDEGHQFDNGTRGITYELLLTSLKYLIPQNAQTILISAVINNAEEIGRWLLDDKFTVAQGSNLSPMRRRIAFAGWQSTLGQLHFMEEDALQKEDFFVPRLISQQPLAKREGEKKERFFPARKDSNPKQKGSNNDIALYLGFKLVNQGSVAIFCGKKETISTICERSIEIFERCLSFPKPLEVSDAEECIKLKNLYEEHLGIDAAVSRAAASGIFSHSRNIPHGVRLAVEHAMKNEDARFIVCTSTLAQGVNLPIKYLIVSGLYQKEKPIKVRDFHNLIGRAGRAGMHVEGTIIFSDPKIYDNKEVYKERWRWRQAQNFLNPNNSEPIVSYIQELFSPLKIENKKAKIMVHVNDILDCYTEDKTTQEEALWELVRENTASGTESKDLEELVAQIKQKFKILAAIESYLMAYWEETVEDRSPKALAEGTLAYTLVSDKNKQQLIGIFTALAHRIHSAVPDAKRRVVFSRTLQGVMTNLELEQWIADHIIVLKQSISHEELLRHIWPILVDGIENKIFQKIDKEIMIKIALAWISGTSFANILEDLKQHGIKINTKKQKRELKIEHIVDMCETGFGYEAVLRVGAIADLLASQEDEDDERKLLVERLGDLHKCLKYGLPQTYAIVLYECGFADRVVAQKLSAVIGSAPLTRSEAISLLTTQRHLAQEVLKDYPKYFQSCLNRLIS